MTSLAKDVLGKGHPLAVEVSTIDLGEATEVPIDEVAEDEDLRTTKYLSLYGKCIYLAFEANGHIYIYGYIVYALDKSALWIYILGHKIINPFKPLFVSYLSYLIHLHIVSLLGSSCLYSVNCL